MRQTDEVKRAVICHYLGLMAAVMLLCIGMSQRIGAAVAQVSGLTAEAVDSATVRLTWNRVPGADGYIIFINDGSGKAELGKVTENSLEVRKDAAGSELAMGKTYGFSVCAYEKGTMGDELSCGESSEEVAVVPVLKAPENLLAEGRSKSVIRLSWQPMPDAEGYQLFRSTREESGYKKITTIKKNTTVRYDNRKCKSTLVYYYKIRSYKTVNGSIQYSEFSDAVVGTVLLKAPKLKSVKLTGGDTALLKWKKVSGASGYLIYRSTKKNSGYKKVKTVKDGRETSVEISGNKNGKKYYFKVRAYGSLKKKQTYSAFSNAKNVTFNLLASEKESYEQKAMRIFGKSSYQKYASEEEARSNMTTIQIAVWDFAADGVTKVTKYKYLTVHRNIAPTVQQIFKEIYEGKEKFPIKNIGGYSWRVNSSSEHCEGLAIDINWEENYMIDNGTILSGKLYQPGVNPYSIPTNGEVAKIMRKYGFYQGIWAFKNRYDYMHFSYFGT